MPINNNHKAEMWAIFAQAALGGINACNIPEVPGANVMGNRDITEQASIQADHMMAKFSVRFPGYTGE